MKRFILLYIIAFIPITMLCAQDSLKVHIKGYFPKSIYKIYVFDKIHELHIKKDKHAYLYYFWIVFPDSIVNSAGFSLKVESRRNIFSKIKTDTLVVNNLSKKMKYFFMQYKLDSLFKGIGFQTEWLDSIDYIEKFFFDKTGFYNFDIIRPYFLPNITYDNKFIANDKKRIIRRRNARHYRNNGLLDKIPARW